MPRLVCVKCEVELRPETNNTLVIEVASFGPYRVWHADTWKCPGCGVEIVSGFGSQPALEHFMDDFDTWLAQNTLNAKRVVYDHERPRVAQ